NIFGGMQRGGGGQGFFRKPYHYESDAVGLRDVPIPVWTTKSFHATYEAPNIAPPIQAELTYYLVQEQGKDLRIAGIVKSGLAVDLDDIWLFYLDKAYPIAGGLAKGADLKIRLELGDGKPVKDWSSSGADGTRTQTAQ